MSGPAPFALLLHAGGWDEILMVAVGLAIAYVILTVSNRRRPPEDGPGSAPGEQTEVGEQRG